MNTIKAIFKREFAAYFRSPMGYVIFAIFLALYGIYFGYSLLSSYISLVGNITFLQSFLFIIIPVLTMRIFSEDRKNGTEVLLLTSPARTVEIVIGKYLAALALFSIMTAGTFVHIAITALFNGIIDIELLGAYIGFFFLGAAYISIGVFASALTENQIIAAVISFVTIFVLTIIDVVANAIGQLISNILSKVNFFGWLTDSAIDNVGNAISKAIQWINPTTRISNYLNGIFEISPLVFFISVVATFIFMTNRIIEKRRWSQR